MKNEKQKLNNTRQNTKNGNTRNTFMGRNGFVRAKFW
jgi:hypothetical protein